MVGKYKIFVVLINSGMARITRVRCLAVVARVVLPVVYYQGALEHAECFRFSFLFLFFLYFLFKLYFYFVVLPWVNPSVNLQVIIIIRFVNPERQCI